MTRGSNVLFVVINYVTILSCPPYFVVAFVVARTAKSHESGLLAQELPSTFFVVQVAGGLVADFTLVVFLFKVFCFDFFIFSILYSPSG
jgi:hypothetical protein